MPPSTISGLDDVGKIWLMNEKAKRQNHSLKRRGIKQIRSYKKDLNKLGKFAD